MIAVKSLPALPWIRFCLSVTVLLLAGNIISAQPGRDRLYNRPVQGVRIAWDYSSLQRLAPRNERALAYAGYPRVKRLKDGRIVSVYEAEGDGEMIQSLDNGVTWSDPVKIFKTFSVNAADTQAVRIHISNTEIIELANGLWMAACNYRPQKDGIAPFSIAITKSSDKGGTWTQPEVIFEAGRSFRDGCWEPAFLQLPAGQLHLYFANEAPYTTSDEQEISVLKSNDNGKTWLAPQTVSFRKQRRDGMPVPLLIDDEILVAIEDNKTDPFKPYIVRTPLTNPWNKSVDGSSSLREYALDLPLPDSVYAGAPYLAKLPSGEVMLSYQTTRGRTSNWEQSTMEVAIGDKQGRGFGTITQPFPVPLHKEAKWNSISIWDEKTVAATAASNFDGGPIAAWLILGKIIPKLVSEKCSIVVDGKLSVNEWMAEMPVFIGHKGYSQLRAAVQHNDRFVYFGVKVSNADSTAGLFEAGDGVNIYLDVFNKSSVQPGKGIYKIACSNKGIVQLFEGQDGKWISKKVTGLKAQVARTGAGYSLELAVPFNVLQKNDRKPIRINIEMINAMNGKEKYTECIANAQAEKPFTWCEVTF